MNANVAVLTRLFGRCTRCIRSSFLASFGTWLLTGIIFLRDVPAGLVIGLAVLASAFTLLWMSHVIAFALRSIKSDANQSITISRRDLIGDFGRSAAFIALATSVLPTFAAAQVSACKTACLAQADTCARGCGYIQDPAQKKICNDGCNSGRDACISRCG